MIVGSLAGPVIAGGGFCAGSEEIVHHQRISASAYTFSAALPALLSTTASETITMMQSNSDLFVQLRSNIKTMWSQIDPRSDWVYCTSAPENPIMILAIKPEVVSSRRLSVEDQQSLLQDVVDEVRFHSLSFTNLLSNRQITDIGKWCSHYSIKVSARQRRAEAARPAGAQGLPDNGPEQARSRKGWHDHSTCNYEGAEQEALVIFIVRPSFFRVYS
jgi:hypothetical protein